MNSLIKNCSPPPTQSPHGDSGPFLVDVCHPWNHSGACHCGHCHSEKVGEAEEASTRSFQAVLGQPSFSRAAQSSTRKRCLFFTVCCTLSFQDKGRAAGVPMSLSIPYENRSCDFCQQTLSPEGLTGPGSRFHDVLRVPHLSLPVPKPENAVQ